MVKQQTLHGPELEQKLMKLLSRANKLNSGTKQGQTSESARKHQESVPPSVFLEMGSFALDYDIVAVGKDCLSAVNLDSIQNEPSLVLHHEILKSQILVEDVVKSTGNIFSKSAVKARVKNVQRLEEVVISAGRIKDNNIIEVRWWESWNS